MIPTDTVGQLRASWSVSNSGLASGLKQSAKMLSAFQKRYQGFGNLELKAQYRGLLSDLKVASKPLDKFKKDYSEIEVGFAASGVRETISAVAGVSAAAKAVDGTNANVEVGSQGTAQTVSALGLVKNRIEEVRKEALALGATSVRFTVGETGALKTAFTLKQVDEEADKLDGRKINLSFSDFDQRVGEALPSIFGSIEAALTRSNIAMAIASSTRVPALLAKYTALAAGSTQLVGASVSLGSALTGGVAAGLTQVGVGFASAGASLFGYGRALSRTYNYAADFNEVIKSQRYALESAQDNISAAKSSLEGAAKGTREYELASRGLVLAEQDLAYQQDRMNVLLGMATPSMLSLNRQINKIRLDLLSFGGAIANEVAPTLINLISTGSEMGRNFGPSIMQMIRQMNGVADGFAEAAGQGRRFHDLKAIFEGVASTGAPALKSVTNVALILLDTLHFLTPSITGIARRMEDLTGSAQKWVESANGQQRISQIWNEMKIRGAQLGTIVRDLGIGFAQVIGAASSADFGGTLLGGIQRFAAGFREATAEGTKVNQQIQKLAGAGGPLLQDIGNFAKTVAQEFFRVATAVSSVKMPDSGLPVLQEIVRNLSEAAPLIATMVIENFSRIGPVIADLIPVIAEFFSVFTPADPVLVATLDIFVDLAEIFQTLSPETQRMVGRIISLTAAFNAMGAGSALGFLGSMITSFIQMRVNLALVSAATGRQATLWGVLTGRIASNTAATNAQAAANRRLLTSQQGLGKGSIASPTAAPVPTTPATGPAAKKTWGTRLAAFAKTLAPIILVATVVLTFDWGAAQSEYQKSRARGEDMGDAFADGFFAGASSIPVLGPVFDGLDKLTTNLESGGKYDGIIGRWAARERGLTAKQFEGQNPFEKMFTVSTALNARIAQFFVQVSEGVRQRAAQMATVAAAAILLTFSNTFQRAKQLAFTGAAAIIVPVVQAWQRLRQATASVWSGITSFLTQVWIQIRTRVVSGVTQVRTFLVSGWNTVRNTTVTAWTQITSRVSLAWTQIRARVVQGINIVRQTVVSGWNTVRNLTQQVWTFITNLLSQTWQRIRSVVQSGISLVRNVVSQGWNFIKTNTSSAWSAVRDFVVNRITEAKSRASEVVSTMREALSSAWSQIRSGAESAWKAIAEAIWQPIEGAVSKVRSFIESIVGIVNAVLSAFGQKTISLGGGSTGGTGSAGGGRGSGGPAQQLATGGVISDDGVRHFASGGTSPMRGGMGTYSPAPRVHEWNEQVGPEAYIVKNRPAREQLPYLKTAADWHGMAVVPADPARAGLGPHARHARGGLEADTAYRRDSFDPVGIPQPVYPVPYMMASFAGGGIGAMYEAVKEKFGVEGFNNHGSYLSGAAATDSLDFMVTTPGNRAEGSEKELGDNIAAFTAPPSAVNTIWYGQANFGAGWEPYSTGPGVGNANTLGHYDHVHAQAHPDSFRGGTGTYPGGGGPGGSSGPSLADQIWEGGAAPSGDWKTAAIKAAANFATKIFTFGRQDTFPGLKDILPELPSGVFGDGFMAGRIADYMGSYKDWVRGYIYDKFGGSGGTGGLPSGDSPSGLTIGEALSQGGWPDNLLTEASSTVWHESTGNARAQNPSGARGLMQIMPGTASGVGADYEKLYDPIYNTSAGKKVYDQAGGWGPWVGAGQGGDYRNKPVTGYDKGGLIPGSAGDPKILLAHAGEIVLPQGISKSFLDFSASLREATKLRIPEHRQAAPSLPVPAQRKIDSVERLLERIASSVEKQTDTAAILERIETQLAQRGIKLDPETRQDILDGQSNAAGRQYGTSQFTKAVRDANRQLETSGRQNRRIGG